MQDLDKNALDRYITGNWGDDSVGLEPPELTDEQLNLICESLVSMADRLAAISPRAASPYRGLASVLARYLEEVGY